MTELNAAVELSDRDLEQVCGGKSRKKPTAGTSTGTCSARSTPQSVATLVTPQVAARAAPPKAAPPKATACDVCAG